MNIFHFFEEQIFGENIYLEVGLCLVTIKSYDYGIIDFFFFLTLYVKAQMHVYSVRPQGTRKGLGYFNTYFHNLFFKQQPPFI